MQTNKEQKGDFYYNKINYDSKVTYKNTLRTLRDIKQNTIQASDVLQYDHKHEENKIATYTGCGNANTTVNSLTKRSGTKKKRCYAVTHINK